MMPWCSSGQQDGARSCRIGVVTVGANRRGLLWEWWSAPSPDEPLTPRWRAVPRAHPHGLAASLTIETQLAQPRPEATGLQLC